MTRISLIPHITNIEPNDEFESITEKENEIIVNMIDKLNITNEKKIAPMYRLLLNIYRFNNDIKIIRPLLTTVKTSSEFSYNNRSSSSSRILQYALLSKFYKSNKKAYKIIELIGMTYFNAIDPHENTDKLEYLSKNITVIPELTLGISYKVQYEYRGNAYLHNSSIPDEYQAIGTENMNSLFEQYFNLSKNEPSVYPVETSKKPKLISLRSQYELNDQHLLWNNEIGATYELEMSPTNRGYLLIKHFSYADLVSILNLLISKKIDFHDFVEVLPPLTFSRLIDMDVNSDNKYSNEIMVYIRSISKYNSNEFLKFLKFVNFEKIRNGKNKSIRETHMKTVSDSNKGLSYSADIESHMRITKADFHEFNRPTIFHTKSPEEVKTIGSRTLCCFTPGGLAKSLLRPATHSPISGIIEGSINSSDTWFSFVWEIVEFNEETKLFETNLILDNVESSRKITIEQWKEIYTWLVKNTSYSKIYMGSSRNDLDHGILIKEGEDEEDYSVIDTRIRRPYTLINYESNFDRYGYDDSVYLNMVNTKPSLIENIKVSRMNDGWHHRVKYVERLLWNSEEDHEFMKIDINKSPSYVIYGDNGSILGYVMTRVVYINKETKEIDYSYKHKADIRNSEEYEKMVYFEDIFLYKNKKIVLSLKPIIRDMLRYFEENNIQKVSSSPNAFSVSFLKRFTDHGIEHIMDTRLNYGAPEDAMTSSLYKEGLMLSEMVLSKHAITTNDL